MRRRFAETIHRHAKALLTELQHCAKARHFGKFTLLEPEWCFGPDNPPSSELTIVKSLATVDEKLGRSPARAKQR